MLPTIFAILGNHSAVMEMMLLFGEFVRRRRRQLGISQEELSVRAGLGVRTIREIENCRVETCRPMTARLLATALELCDVERERFYMGALGSAASSAVGVLTGSGSGVIRPAQLPADVATFTGREEYLRRLDALLPVDGQPAGAVVSVISGAAGAGKTALAVHWAHRVRERFIDGQLYIDLRSSSNIASLRPIDALTKFLHALGISAEQTPTDLDEAAALYRSVLAERRILVILDDAARAEQVLPLLPGSGGCLALVTSRGPMIDLVAHSGVNLIAMGALTPAESTTLLGRILGIDRVMTEESALAECARLCGHLPSALRIAAANLEMLQHEPTTYWSPPPVAINP